MKEVAMSDPPHRLGQSVLTIRSEPQADAHLVTLAGEMDGSNARDVEDEFIRIEATPVSLIVLDLGSLEFIDSTGLAVIVRAHRRAQNNGHRFGIKRPRGHVSRLFELCGLDRQLSFVT
jgi:anti-sigma B factor antagonist